VGNVIFLLNVLALILGYYRAICVKAYAAVTTRLEPAPGPSTEVRV